VRNQKERIWARKKMLQVAADYERMAENRDVSAVDKFASNPELPKPRWYHSRSLSFLGSVLFEFWKNELAETLRVTLARARTFDHLTGHKFPDRFVPMW
jgi:hypothetical protein